MRQIKFKIDTTFSDNISAGVAAKYLNSGEIFLRDGVEIAISCLFAPIGAAVEGETRAEVEARCEVSRMQFETYMKLALSRVGKLCLTPEHLNQIDVTELTQTISPTEFDNQETVMASGKSSDSEDIVMASGFSDNKPLYINFDEEEF